MTASGQGGVVVQSNIRRRVGGSRSRRVYEPLTFWQEGLSSKSGGRYRMVVKALGRVALFNEPQWDGAARGDPACTIGVAVHHLLIAPSLPDQGRVNMVMSALWRTAMDGDPAAIALFRQLEVRLL